MTDMGFTLRICSRIFGDAAESRLAGEVEGGGLKIAAKIELKAVMHPPRAGGTFGSAGECFAFDPDKLVCGGGFKPL